MVAAKRLPRIASACPGMTSHRFHRCNFRGVQQSLLHNQANSSPPTDFTEFTEPSAGDSLPQISQIYIDGLSAEDSSGGILASATAKCLPQIAQIYTEAANFRGCTCLKCTNIARGAPT